MAKFTVLEIVQQVLNDGSGDYVNSINDTEEAEQIANIVLSTYQAIISNRNWEHTKRILTLTPSGDSLLPTHMSIEDNMKELISIYYNKIRDGETAIQYREVKWKEPDDFLRLTFGRNSTSTNTITVDDPSGVKLLILNDKAPDYYTTFDDTTLVFDSYDASVDTTLQSNKTLARGYIFPAFELEDTFVPDLPEEAFTAFIEEVKSKCAFKLNQVQDIKSEQEAGRQQRWLSRKSWRVKGGIRYPNYGRRRNNAYRDPTFRED